MVMTAAARHLGLGMVLLAMPRVGTSTDPGKTLRMQVLLDRAHFSPGEIDGKPGSNSSRALAAYSKAHGLREGSAGLRKFLSGDTAPTLVKYTLTEDDVAASSGIEIPEDMMEKAKLESLGYASVIEAVAERFHASPELLRRLNPHASWNSAGEDVEVPNARTDPPTGKVVKVIVDASDLSVLTVGPDERVLTRYPASMGSQFDPLPVGEWKVKGVQKNPPFFYNPDLFWDADETHAKARIPPGPNNPVGVVWIDLSKEHYGIHGTPEPASIGKTQSHGCIRLTNWDAAELAGLVTPGQQAVLRR
jgi:lipoprotein-anchoring transpeptidase ErfK/SrfK